MKIPWRRSQPAPEPKPPPEPEPTPDWSDGEFSDIAEQMIQRKGVRFLHCETCACVFVAIFEPATKQLVGIGCPECKYAWPLSPKGPPTG